MSQTNPTPPLDHDLRPDTCFRQLMEHARPVIDAADAAHERGEQLTSACGVDRYIALMFGEIAHLAAMDKRHLLDALYDCFAVADALTTVTQAASGKGAAREP